ncbi:MAG: hypothetical protein MNPFHGCM_00824 [Gemmatimonadaceae bacterium]|nr:hypothetical protein [Gemmatimonadaceae bacterium]
MPAVRGQSLWRAAQAIGLVLTVVLIAALWVTPTVTLHILWDMVIPLLPATFLINPLIWRNVCPLATLNDLSGSRVGQRIVETRLLRAAWVVGIVLLAVLVPARRFLFNENGPALAITILLVALLALVSGLRYARRAGFCGSLCPVLPVEKLYGQLPLLPMDGARCTSCSQCTPVGCIDLANSKTVAQTIGPERRDARWVRTGFGAFAAAFPGFIIGYFTTVNGDFVTAGTVYGRVLLLAAASYLIVAVLVAVFRLRASLSLPFLGATSLGLYYWYAAPPLVEAYAGPSQAVAWVRAAIGLMIAYWLVTWRSRASTVAATLPATR